MGLSLERRFCMLSSKNVFCAFLLFMGAKAPLQSQNYIWIEFNTKPKFNYQTAQQQISETALKKRLLRGIPLSKSDMPINKTHIQSVEQSLSAKCIHTSKWLNAGLFALRNNIPPKKTIDQLQQIKTYTFLLNQHKPLKKTQESPLDYGASKEMLGQIKTPFLHQKGYAGETMSIAVFDGGFSYTDQLEQFEHLFEDQKIIATYDFVHDTSFVFDHSAHGMNVLGFMAAKQVGHYIGTAPNAHYALFITEDVTQESLMEEIHWLLAAEKADSLGIDIINSSLGYTEFDDPSQNHTYADLDGNTTIVTRAADMAAQKGILVVNSAGNSGSSPWKYISAPADADSILAVGAVNNKGEYVNFSSIGPSADQRIKPEVACWGNKNQTIGFNGETYPGSGTSFAAPLIAGSAACLWQAYPEYTNMDIIESISKSAHQYHAPDRYLGYGIPNFEGAFSLLDIIKNPSENILLYPTTTSHYFTALLSKHKNTSIQITFYTTSGQLLYTHIQNTDEKGRIDLSFSLPDLASQVLNIEFMNTLNGSFIGSSKINFIGF